MFVVGFVVGPVIAVLLVRLLAPYADLGARELGGAYAVLLCVLLVLPITGIELRIGLFMGGFLGLLVAATPVTIGAREEKLGDPAALRPR